MHRCRRLGAGPSLGQGRATLSIRYADRLAANDIVASVGSKGDSFDCRRLDGTITTDAGYTTPAAHEAAFYRQSTPAPEPVTQ